MPQILGQSETTFQSYQNVSNSGSAVGHRQHPRCCSKSQALFQSAPPECLGVQTLNDMMQSLEMGTQGHPVTTARQSSCVHHQARPNTLTYGAAGSEETVCDGSPLPPAACPAGTPVQSWWTQSPHRPSSQDGCGHHSPPSAQRPPERRANEPVLPTVQERQEPNHGRHRNDDSVLWVGTRS